MYNNNLLSSSGVVGFCFFAFSVVLSSVTEKCKRWGGGSGRSGRSGRSGGSGGGVDITTVCNRVENNSDVECEKILTSLFGLTGRVNVSSNDVVTMIPISLVQSRYYEKVKLALESALKCGGRMVRYDPTSESESDLKVKSKDGTLVDFATWVDVRNEADICEMIRGKFPGDNVIGEESVESAGSGGYVFDNGSTWIIDPVDGTTNFASGNPMCCVSIGYAENKVVQFGVVVAPFIKEVYITVKGMGAWKNCRPMSLLRDKKLEDCNLAFEFGYARDFDSTAVICEAAKKLLCKGVRSMRQYGSGVLDLCWVAGGEIDAVYTGVKGEGWKIWDYAAGGLVVEECGGCLENLRKGGKEDGGFDITGKDMVASCCGAVNEEIRRIVL